MHVFAKYRTIVLIAASLAFGCGCRLAPVYSPTATVPVSRDMPSSLDRTREGIVRALAEKGWNVLEDELGMIKAQVHAGGHHARVQIEYSSTYYTLSHVMSSPGLKFDGKSIHRRYNHWVATLAQTIDRKITELSLAQRVDKRAGSKAAAVAVKVPPAVSADGATAMQPEPSEDRSTSESTGGASAVAP